jgi:hypothetical protein
MLGLRQRIAFIAVLLIALVPSGSKAFTVQECYDAVEQAYANCTAVRINSNFGLCENRRAERLASCSQGVWPGPSPKDQCLERVEAEYRACGYRAVCTNRWIQGLQQCN